jgi:type I restriction enzyme, S subunit
LGGSGVSDIPEGWVTTAFNEINCFLPKTINPSLFGSEIFELFSVPSFPNRKPEIVRGEEIGSTKQIVEPGDVLVCKINPRINRVWQVTPKRQYRQIASSEWIVMRAPKLDARYLTYYFANKEFRRLLCADVSGIGGSLTRAQPSRVAKLSIKIAPLEEQRRIADKLDVLMAEVNACRELLDNVLIILKRFQQVVLDLAASGQFTEDSYLSNNYEANKLPLSSLLSEPLRNGKVFVEAQLIFVRRSKDFGATTRLLNSLLKKETFL